MKFLILNIKFINNNILKQPVLYFTSLWYLQFKENKFDISFNFAIDKIS